MSMAHAQVQLQRCRKMPRHVWHYRSPELRDYICILLARARWCWGASNTRSKLVSSAPLPHSSIIALSSPPSANTPRINLSQRFGGLKRNLLDF